MSTEVRTSAGSSIAISASLPATEDQTGYEALTFTTIGEITNIGEFGRTYEEATHNPLASRRTEKYRGAYDPGSLTLEMANVEDAGQALLIANRDDATDPNYSFKITDKGGRVYYMQGLVMQYSPTIGTTSDIITAACNVAINSDIVEIAAP